MNAIKGVKNSIQIAYKRIRGAYKCIKGYISIREHIYGRNMDKLGLIKQLISI